MYRFDQNTIDRTKELPKELNFTNSDCLDFNHPMCSDRARLVVEFSQLPWAAARNQNRHVQNLFLEYL